MPKTYVVLVCMPAKNLTRKKVNKMQLEDIFDMESYFDAAPEYTAEEITAALKELQSDMVYLSNMEMPELLEIQGAKNEISSLESTLEAVEHFTSLDSESMEADAYQIACAAFHSVVPEEVWNKAEGKEGFVKRVKDRIAKLIAKIKAAISGIVKRFRAKGKKVNKQMMVVAVGLRNGDLVCKEVKPSEKLAPLYNLGGFDLKDYKVKRVAREAIPLSDMEATVNAIPGLAANYSKISVKGLVDSKAAKQLGKVWLEEMSKISVKTQTIESETHTDVFYAYLTDDGCAIVTESSAALLPTTMVSRPEEKSKGIDLSGKESQVARMAEAIGRSWLSLDKTNLEVDKWAESEGNSTDGLDTKWVMQLISGVDKMIQLQLRFLGATALLISTGTEKKK
ncbi:hypothetical protein [Vibrio phage vB_pir03]|nr:hypothetical protein [Vibrio phage vB_pir03]